jgi:hypothetical protein
VAVKEISFATRNASEVEELRKEINLMRSLRHKNVVAYMGTEVRGQTLFILTEWVPGGSLLDMLEKFKKLHVNVIRFYTKQLLDGLAYLHANNVIHRDIKCANILVDDHGVVSVRTVDSCVALRSVALLFLFPGLFRTTAQAIAGTTSTTAGTKHYHPPPPPTNLSPPNQNPNTTPPPTHPQHHPHQNNNTTTKSKTHKLTQTHLTAAPKTTKHLPLSHRSNLPISAPRSVSILRKRQRLRRQRGYARQMKQPQLPARTMARRPTLRRMDLPKPSREVRARPSP